MIVGMKPQHFLRHEFERKQKLRAVRQQQIQIFAFEFNDNIRIFKIRMAVVSGFDIEIQLEASRGNHLTEKLLDPRTSFMHRILGIQARLPSFTLAFFAALQPGPLFC
jgi:hypothetical protein